MAGSSFRGRCLSPRCAQKRLVARSRWRLVVLVGKRYAQGMLGPTTSRRLWLAALGSLVMLSGCFVADSALTSAGDASARDSSGDGCMEDSDCPTGELCIPGPEGASCACDAQPEICDSVDNDCDSSTPDGSEDERYLMPCDGEDEDACLDGLMVCEGGAFVCDDDESAGPDICDGVDNDCDSSTPDGSEDDRLGAACDGVDLDLCLEGVTTCAEGSVVCSDDTDDALEVCDGADNDCDPTTADGAGDVRVGAPCDGDDADLCADGMAVCDAGRLACDETLRDTSEICDGVDNDCDPGTADGSADARVGLPCDGLDSDLCEEGMTACRGGSVECADMTGDSLEICDALDNDCDGVVDQGETCSPCVRATLAGAVYLLCGEEVEWEVARSACMRRGYRLTSIATAAEDEFLSSTALAEEDEDWWIGMNDIATEGTWVWESGEAVGFTNWGSGEPGNYSAGSYDCGVIEDGSAPFEDPEEWADRPCDNDKPYICEL